MRFCEIVVEQRYLHVLFIDGSLPLLDSFRRLSLFLLHNFLNTFACQPPDKLRCFRLFALATISKAAHYCRPIMTHNINIQYIISLQKPVSPVQISLKNNEFNQDKSKQFCFDLICNISEFIYTHKPLEATCK